MIKKRPLSLKFLAGLLSSGLILSTVPPAAAQVSFGTGARPVEVGGLVAAPVTGPAGLGAASGLQAAPALRLEGLSGLSLFSLPPGAAASASPAAAGIASPLSARVAAARSTTLSTRALPSVSLRPFAARAAAGVRAAGIAQSLTWLQTGIAPDASGRTSEAAGKLETFYSNGQRAFEGSVEAPSPRGLGSLLPTRGLSASPAPERSRTGSTKLGRAAAASQALKTGFLSLASGLGEAVLTKALPALELIVPALRALRGRGTLALRGPPPATNRFMGLNSGLGVAVGIPIALGLFALGVAAFVYDVYLFFDLFSFFHGAPFHYGILARAFAAFVATGVIGGVIGKTVSFFKGGGKDDKSKSVDEEKALKFYIASFGTIALIGLPFILHAHWGTLASSAALGFQYFVHWKFQYLLGGLLGLSLLMHLFHKLRGAEDDNPFGVHVLKAVVATFIAPVAEEIVFRWGLFNIAKWFYAGLLGFTEPVHYVLPLFHLSVGWGLPLGVLLAMFGNADSFFKAHGKGKWFHHWFMGVIASYAYFMTGNLVVPIAIHFIWNGLCSLFDVALNTAVPLKG